MSFVLFLLSSNLYTGPRVCGTARQHCGSIVEQEVPLSSHSHPLLPTDSHLVSPALDDRVLHQNPNMVSVLVPISCTSTCLVRGVSLPKVDDASCSLLTSPFARSPVQTSCSCSGHSQSFLATTEEHKIASQIHEVSPVCSN